MKMNGVQEESDYFCPVCGVDFLLLYEFEEHRKTNDHRIKWLNRQYKKDRLTYLKNKNGLSINAYSAKHKITDKSESYTIVTDFSNENCPPLNTEFNLNLVHNGTVPFYITGVDILNDVRLVETGTSIEIEDKYQMSKRTKVLNITPGKNYEILCKIRLGTITRPLHIPLLFELQHILEQESPLKLKTSREPFYIGRTIEIGEVTHSVRDFGNYVPGVYPLANDNNGNCLDNILPLRQYRIPGWFQTLAYNNQPKDIREKMEIKKYVNFDTYQKFFSTLLWLEELQEELDIQFYSKKGVNLNFNNYQTDGYKLVELQEKGLAENRPCVMRKDKVFVCVTDEAQDSINPPQWYEGIVHKVKNTSICLGFDQQEFVEVFHNKTKFNVEYVINRYPFRVCHRAVELCHSQNFRRRLFPYLSNRNTPQADLTLITLYDNNINSNFEQRQAVQHIVAGSSHSTPYIVFGPPGTGKTVTLVESIKQILFNVGKSYVLACAPSNTSADVIAERLLDHFTSHHVIRLYANSRTSYLRTLPRKLIEASNFNEVNGTVFFPPKKELMKKRVIVCTFITAARLAGACFPRGHFSHVILDEAGHAMECEALVAIGGILSAKGHLILAGDPHQLGPVIRNISAMAKGPIFPQTGLDTSLLERIMAMPQYSKSDSGYNPMYVTKLVKNYRSHFTILHVPNKLFYNSELEAKGDPDLVNYFINWKHLPKKGFPLIVHSVSGEDKMEKYSPSYHNPGEAAVVLSYLEKLLCEQTGITPSDIGIITPYRLQVEKVREAVKKKFQYEFIKKLKIGSVEDFQGEERKVIIISTVRATKRHLAKDNLFKLGFLRNPKRFNVAVTRAKCLLILVCCANVLVLDSHWKKLIDYVKAHKGYVGDPYREPSMTIDELLERMGNLDIRPNVGDISQRQVVELPAMRIHEN